MFLCGYLFLPHFGKCLGAQLLGHMVSLCKYMVRFVRNYQTAFQSSIITHSQQQQMRVPVPPNPSLHLVLSVIFIFAILMVYSGPCYILCLFSIFKMLFLYNTIILSITQLPAIIFVRLLYLTSNYSSYLYTSLLC